MVAALSLALAGACDDEEEREQPAASAPAAAEQAAEPRGEEPGAPETRAPAESLPEDRARAALERWLEAQNEGDFDSYRALYAERFEGVKRSGPRTSRFDRESWLKDRKKMFARPMTVKAKSVDLQTTPRSAIVTFEQHWSSPTYEDVGPKRLVLVPDDGELRIAREAMLRSEILEESTPSTSLPPLERFAFVIEAQRPHVVLSLEPEASWAQGPPGLVSDGDPVVVRRATGGAVPEALAAWRGRRMTLYGESGRRCAGELGEPVLLRRVVPHFGTRKDWAGEMGTPPAGDEEIAAQAWKLGADAELLAAPIEGTKGECAGALWARAAEPQGDEAPAATVFRPKPAAAEVRKAALESFRELPAWKALQGEYRAYGAGKRGRWDEHDGAEPTVRTWQAGDGGPTFVTVSVHAGVGCGDFEGMLWALFEQTGAGLSPKVDGEDPGWVDPLAMADVDGDGRPEVLGDTSPFVEQHTLLRPSKRGYAEVAAVAPTFLDCGC